jgi:hypothetical protein
MKRKVSVTRRISPLILCLFAFTAMAQAQENLELANCNASVEGSMLIVIGNEIANTIELVGCGREIQVSCDGVSETFRNIQEVRIESGDGNDITSRDNSEGFFGGIAIQFNSGIGIDTLQSVGGG